MAYFLKLVGVKENPLPRRWWEGRPEILSSIFFAAIRARDEAAR